MAESGVAQKARRRFLSPCSSASNHLVYLPDGTRRVIVLSVWLLPQASGKPAERFDVDAAEVFLQFPELGSNSGSSHFPFRAITLFGHIDAQGGER